MRRPPLRRERKTRIRRLIAWCFAAAGLWLVLSLAVVLSYRWLPPPVSMVMLLEPGPVGAIDYRWVDRSRIAPALAEAVIAAEDQRFLSHRGFDYAEIKAAVADYRRGDGLRGASTITQQVAKNLFLWNGRSLVRKGLEAWFTVLIELCWSKQRTLEVYLNVAEIGPHVFGVEAAATTYFGRSAAQMTSADAALIAAALPSPKRFDLAAPSDDLRMRERDIRAQMRLLEQRGHYSGLDWLAN